MAKKDVNMLEGSVFKGIIAFSLPVIAAGILQLMFQAADLIVLGRFCGSASVGAAGSTVSITHLLINLFIGISVGTGVATAHAVGEKDNRALHRVVHTALPTAILIGIFLTAVGVIFAEALLKAMETPNELLRLATVYMRIIFCGIAFNMVYNFCAAILRALGDTRSPLIFLTFSGFLNVILNVIFVVAFNMNVAGVALATIISQFVSSFLVTLALIRRTDAAKLCITKIRIYKDSILKIFKIGIPSGIQSCMFSLSNVLIQSSINSLGEATVSGSAAAHNIEAFVYIVMNSFYQATINFVGQNYGIKNFKRIKEIVKKSLVCVTIVGVICAIIVFSLSRQLLSLYITDNDKAISQGVIRLAFICLPYFLCGIMEVSTGAIRGMGISVPPMIISILGVCVFRVVWIYSVFKTFNTAQSIYISYPISWALTFIAQIITFAVIFKHKKYILNSRR